MDGWMDGEMDMYGWIDKVCVWMWMDVCRQAWAGEA